MIPDIDILTEEIPKTKYSNRTYKIALNANRISGYTDDLEAVMQTVYLILSSERYKHIIYSWDYGFESLDLYGKPMSYVMSELPTRVKEALTQDDRITDVVNFEFEQHKNHLYTTFTVISTAGDFSTGVEVKV